METKNNYIDELVRNSLPDIEPSQDDAVLWARIDNTMKYKRFFKFSINTFNIYYSAVILLVIIYSAAYFLNNKNLKNISIENKNIPVVTQPAPVIEKNVQETPPSSNTSGNKITSIPHENKQNVQDINLKKTNQISSTVKKTEKENNISAAAETEHSTSKKTKKVKVVKKQVVITDTVRQKNTVIIKKQAD